MHQNHKAIHFKSKNYYGTKTYKICPINENLIQFICTTNPLKNNPIFKTKRKIPPFLQKNPYCFFRAYSKLKSYVILGIGANCGDCLVRFLQLLHRLKTKNTIISTTPILKNPAFGYTAQADFYNAIIWLKTRLGIVEFWSLCAYLERIFGRERKRPFKNAPRTLDLDIIGFKNKKIRLRHLEIPHIAWNERDSVKIPLFGLWRKQ